MTHSWQPIDLAALGDVPPEVPTLSGLLYPGALHLLYGEPEAAKTWLALIVAAEQVRAGSNIIYVDHEMSPIGVRRRLLDLGLTAAELERFRYLQPSERSDAKEIRADLESMLVTCEPSLIVVDALAGALGLHGLDGNSNADVESFYGGTLAPFRATGAAILLIDHVVKNREERGRWPIGAQRKLGGADVGILMEMVTALSRGHKGLAKLRVQKDRHGALPRPYACELELASDAETGAVSWGFRQASGSTGDTGDTWKPDFLMERVFSFLKERGEPVSRSTVRDTVRGKREYVKQAIDCLIAEGTIEETIGAHGAKFLACPSLPRRAPGDLGRTETTGAGAACPAPLSLQGGNLEGQPGGGQDDIPF